MLLTWNLEDYGGIKKIRIDPSLVWIPDIVLYTRSVANNLSLIESVYY